mmetsp:Transcript_100012/g.260783  ORF Transcript_100012/g.260783 Transcript_100012/m.260783 type:complete len:226 (+) Transcript_100012:87-764(+)
MRFHMRKPIAKMTASRTMVMTTICVPRTRTVLVMDADCFSMTASDSFDIACSTFALTSPVLLSMDSSFFLWVAASFSRSVRMPTMLVFSFSTVSLCAVGLLPGEPASRLVSVTKVLQSLASLDMRLSRCATSFQSLSSSGTAAAMWSLITLVNLSRWSVCDFWSTKCLWSSVSISLYASWILDVTSFISSPMTFSSKLLTSTSTMDTASEAPPGGGEPLRAVKPM